MFKYLIKDEKFTFSKENFLVNDENIDLKIEHLARVASQIQELDNSYNPYTPLKNLIFATIYAIENLFLKNPDLYNVGIFAFEESKVFSPETKKIYVLKNYSMSTVSAINTVSRSAISPDSSWTKEQEVNQILRLLAAEEEKELNLDYEFIELSGMISGMSSLHIRQSKELKEFLNVLTNETFLKESNFLSKERRIEIYQRIVSYFMPAECFNYDKLFKESEFCLEIRGKKYNNINEVLGLHSYYYVSNNGLSSEYNIHLNFIYLNLIYLQFKHKTQVVKIFHLDEEGSQCQIFCCVDNNSQVDVNEYFYCKNIASQFNKSLMVQFIEESEMNKNRPFKEISLSDFMRLCMINPNKEEIISEFNELFNYIDKIDLHENLQEAGHNLYEKMNKRL